METKSIVKKKKKRKRKKKTPIKKKVLSKKPKREHGCYRIIITSQNKIMICVYKDIFKKSSVIAFNKILEENKKTVRFPIRYSIRNWKMMESKYELLLMKNKTALDSDTTLLRNEYGQLVPHVANTSKMIIYDKQEYLIEESFWVYGFNPKSQRKDFYYILNEIVMKDLPIVKYPVKSLYVYKNKLIIQSENDFDIVICKCENDSARLYTEIEKEIKVKKIKSVFFAGMAKGVMKNRIEAKIMEKTNWNMKKITRNSTRP